MCDCIQLCTIVAQQSLSGFSDKKHNCNPGQKNRQNVSEKQKATASKTATQAKWKCKKQDLSYPCIFAVKRHRLLRVFSANFVNCVHITSVQGVHVKVYTYVCDLCA